MKPIRVYLLGIVCLFAVSAVCGQAVPTKVELRSGQLDEMRKHADHLKTTYREIGIVPNTPDYVLFEQIAVAALFAPQFIEDLIDLTVIKDRLPDSTEPIPPFGFSPAGRQLLMLGEASRQPIEARMAGSTLTDWQRQVLKDVLHFLDVDQQRKDPTSAGVQAKAIRQAAIARMAKDGTLGVWPDLPSNPTPPSEAPEPLPPQSRAWIVWLFAVLAAITGLWLLVRKSSK